MWHDSWSRKQRPQQDSKNKNTTRKSLRKPEQGGKNRRGQGDKKPLKFRIGSVFYKVKSGGNRTLGDRAITNAYTYCDMKFNTRKINTVQSPLTWLKEDPDLADISTRITCTQELGLNSSPENWLFRRKVRF